MFLGDAFGKDGFKSIGKDFGNNFVDAIVEGDKSKVFHGGWVVFLGIRTIGVLLTWGGRYPDSS